MFSETAANDDLQAILDRLPPKPPRSKLEPYAELIQELRKRGRSYRDIAGILTACISNQTIGLDSYTVTEYAGNHGTETQGRKRIPAKQGLVD